MSGCRVKSRGTTSGSLEAAMTSAETLESLAAKISVPKRSAIGAVEALFIGKRISREVYDRLQEKEEHNA